MGVHLRIVVCANAQRRARARVDLYRWPTHTHKRQRLVSRRQLVAWWPLASLRARARKLTSAAQPLKLAVRLAVIAMLLRARARLCDDLFALVVVSIYHCACVRWRQS